MLKAKDLAKQSIEELTAEYHKLCHAIYELINELNMSRKLEKPHELKEKKKDRARVLTVLRSKKNQGSA